MIIYNYTSSQFSVLVANYANIPAVNIQSRLRTMLIHQQSIFSLGLELWYILMWLQLVFFFFFFFISVLIHAVVEFLEVHCYINQPLCITEQSNSYSVLLLPPQLRPSVSESGLLHVARRPCPSLSCSLVSVAPRQSPWTYRFPAGVVNAPTRASCPLFCRYTNE